jgi:nitroreductase
MVCRIKVIRRFKEKYMDNFLKLASARRSIRKFEDKNIPDADIDYFIQAAICAPSGCNSQCWKFVAIKDKEIIGRIHDAVIQSIEDLLKENEAQISDTYWESRKKLAGFFAKAPVVIAVFMTKAKYNDPVMISALVEHGYDNKAIMDLYGNYDILSIGAAIQNLLLAVQEKGYGACWMNDPALAGEKINAILGESTENKFMSLIPIGVPKYVPRQKYLKELGEVFSIV